MNGARWVLCSALFALAGLYGLWFGNHQHWIFVAMFALPPAWLAIALLRGNTRAGFWAAVLALWWFAHGVMAAWTRPSERVYACAAIALALLVVFAASLPGVLARFARSRA